MSRARFTSTSTKNPPSTAPGPGWRLGRCWASYYLPASSQRALRGRRRAASSAICGGMSRADLKDLGEALDDGEASLVVFGQDKLEETLKKDLKRAARTYEKQTDADAAEFRRELDSAIDEVKV